MAKYIQNIDIMGKDFKFNIDGGSFKTPFGGFISILIGLSSIYLTYYFGKDIYERKNPNYLVNKDIKKEEPIFPAKENNFFFGTIIQDSNSLSIMDPKYIEYQLFEKDVKVNITTGEQYLSNIKEIELETCQKKKIGEGIYNAEYFFNYKCPKNLNFSFGGSWNDHIIFPHFIIKICDEDTEKKYNIKCEFDKLKNNDLFLTILIENILIDTASFDNPISGASYLYAYHPLAYKKGMTFRRRNYYSGAKLITDDGLIFENDTISHFVEFENNINENLFDSRFKNVLAIMEMFSTKIHRTYERHYIKIPDIVANTGGFIGLGMTILQFLYDYYIENQYFLYLYKTLFLLGDEIEMMGYSNEINNKIDISKEILNNPDDTCNENLEIKKIDGKLENKPIMKDPFKPKCNNGKKHLYKNQFQNQKENLNMDIKAVIGQKKKNLKKIEISGREKFVIDYCSCCSSKNKESQFKQDLINKTDKLIDERCDIINLLKILDQFNLMKKIIINDNQNFMIKNRTLHTLTLNSNNKEDEEINEKKVESLIQYLSERKQNNLLNDTDILFYLYLDEKIKEKVEKEVKIS